MKKILGIAILSLLLSIKANAISKKEFTDVQLNVKRWQEVTKLSDGSEQLNRILSMLTGSH